MKKIILGKTASIHKGMCALVDNEDFEELNQYNWFAWLNKCTVKYYAMRNRRKGESSSVYMARQLMGYPKGFEVDHKNHDTLDNRKGNLRVVTKTQNHRNMLPFKGAKSRYKGVSRHKAARSKETWRARIWYKGREISLGLFEYTSVGEKKAAQAYDTAARNYYGEHAYLNFPDD